MGKRKEKVSWVVVRLSTVAAGPDDGQGARAPWPLTQGKCGNLGPIGAGVLLGRRDHSSAASPPSLPRELSLACVALSVTYC